MSRPLRLAYPGALYHITARGNRRGDIYRTDDDRIRFNQILGEVVARFSWRIYAWCQMSDHYHLLVETPLPNLPEAMYQLNGKYAIYFNRQHQLVGHVFQGRYIAIHVDKEAYFRELLRYVVLNPVRAGMVSTADAWPWSSYQEMVSIRPAATWSSIDSTLKLFGKKRHQAVQNYAKFVTAGIGSPSPWDELNNGVFLGSAQFVDALLEQFGDDALADEIPRAHQKPRRKSIAACAQEAQSRDDATVCCSRKASAAAKIRFRRLLSRRSSALGISARRGLPLKNSRCLSMKRQ